MKWLGLVIEAFVVYFLFLFLVVAPGPAAIKVLPFITRAVATATSTPPPGNPNIGVFDMLGNRTVAPTPFPPNTQGVFFGVGWTQIEHVAHVFDWTPITSVLSTLPAGKYAQVVINVGAYESPIGPIDSLTGKAWQCENTTYNPAPSPCSAWLATAGATGITTYTAQGPNGSSHGYPSCTPLTDPDPGNSNYQAAWEEMVAAAFAFAASPSAQGKIALLSISPFSDVGGNLSVSTTTGCITPCPSGIIANGPAGTQTCWNNQIWQAFTGYTLESDWSNHLTTAFNTLWNYEISVSGATNIALWTVPGGFPDITAPSTLDNKIRNAMFTYAAAHQPSLPAVAYVNNEALQQNTSWAVAVAQVAALGGYGAQMAKTYTFPSGVGSCTYPSCGTQCDNLKDAGVKYGALANPAADWEQIYFFDVQNCSQQTVTTCPGSLGTPVPSLQCISHALGGP